MICGCSCIKRLQRLRWENEGIQVLLHSFRFSLDPQRFTKNVWGEASFSWNGQRTETLPNELSTRCKFTISTHSCALTGQLTNKARLLKVVTNLTRPCVGCVWGRAEDSRPPAASQVTNASFTGCCSALSHFPVLPRETRLSVNHISVYLQLRYFDCRRMFFLNFVAFLSFIDTLNLLLKTNQFAVKIKRVNPESVPVPVL